MEESAGVRAWVMVVIVIPFFCNPNI